MPDLALAGERLIASVENARAPFTVNYTAISTNTPGTPVTTETAWISTPAITFLPGRSYRLTIKGLLTPTAASSEGRIRVHRDTVSGATLYDSFRITTPSSGANYGFEFSNLISNNGSSAVSAVLVGTVSRDSGTATYSVASSATHVAYLHTEDFGPASDFPGATPL
ncbi:hypothetical protein C5F59_027425 [Streptomyces sp. QL37]|uniref:hypothetical protein n=1 Tax=Streptomyces sp. QL37 TaxID=2093747 RepID=UPI000CF2C1B4|nr:hypothetical protein [Streptomyces sp. QL37]PPQ57153.1 hypothetical protein C5F59_11005 [Streptomyces sp. QL37]